MFISSRFTQHENQIDAQMKAHMGVFYTIPSDWELWKRVSLVAACCGMACLMSKQHTVVICSCSCAVGHISKAPGRQA